MTFAVFIWSVAVTTWLALGAYLVLSRLIMGRWPGQ